MPLLQCGLSATESDSKLQDELSDLINQHLTLSQPAIAEKQLGPASPITYITQHYHHSAHINTTPTTAMPDADRLANLGIDVSALSHAQMRLFSNAFPEQQQRLIELWQIAPPTHSERNVGNWPPTSLEQEEEAARTRYLKLTSPITLEEHASIAPTDHMQSQHSEHITAEPYMAQGYSAPEANNNQYSPSLDPVYQHQNNDHNNEQSREWWAMTNASQPMEHQYGALMQMREFYDRGTSQHHAGSREEDMW